MRKFLAIIVIVLIIGAVFLGYNYASAHLESIASKFLEQNFKARISVGRIGIHLPLCLELKDVGIEDLIDIKGVRLYPSPTSFLLRDKAIILSAKIMSPVVRIKKGHIKDLNVASFLKEDKDQPVSTSIKNQKFYLSRIRIQNGLLRYDRGRDILEFVDIKGNIENPGSYLSRDNICQFSAAGFLKSRDSDSPPPLKIDGVFEPDGIIKARLQASGLKLDSFGVIYTKYLSSLIESGRIDFKSDIEISKKRLIAKCSVEGKGIALKKRPDQEMEAPIVANFILLINFRSNLIKIKHLRGNFLKAILSRR